MTKLLFILLLLAMGCELPIGMRIINYYNMKITEISKNAQTVFDELHKLEEGDKILISFEYGENAKSEIEPMSIALFQHMFSKGVKVYIIALWPEGALSATNALNVIHSSELFNIKENQDYVNLGYKPGGPIIIRGIASDIRSIYKQDVNLNSINDIEIMIGINSIRDFDLVFDLSAGVPGNAEWVQFACDEYNVPLLSGCTSVMKADSSPYVKSGQIKGMLAGLSEAIEYKNLVEKYLKNRQIEKESSYEH